MESRSSVGSAKVLVEREQDVLIVEINRPSALNAIDLETLSAFAAALTDEHLAGVRALVVRGRGDHFSAGADVGAVAEVTTLEQADHFIGLFQSTFARLRDIAIPTFAA